MTKLKLILNLGFIKEAISSFIPTFFAYLDIFKKTLTENEAIGFSILIFLLLFLILVFVKVREYQRSVSRALANGYFKNFIEKLVNLCVSKGENKIEFFFAKEEKGFTPSQISIKIFLTDSINKLRAKDEEIKKLASIAYIDKNAYNHPFFIWAKAENDKLIIFDTPRTLFSLKDYVDPEIESDTELDKVTKTFFKNFNSEFRKLWTRLDKGGLNINIEEVNHI